MILDPVAPAAGDSVPVAETPSTVGNPNKLERLPHLFAWDHVAAMRIPIEMLRCEPKLFESKWFDYRFTHPAHATELFADRYAQTYRELWRKYRDATEASLKQGFRGDSLFASSSRTVTSMWAARQAADTLGLPYEFFIRRSSEILLRRWKNLGLPRPNQLLRPDLVHELMKQWQEWCDSRLMHADHPRYLNCNDRGEPAQRAYHDWLVAQIRRRGAPPYLVGKACLELQQLPEARARAEFGDEKVDRARDEVPVSPPQKPMSAADWETQMPAACFGVPHAPQSADALCRACRHFAACEAFSGRMLGLVRATNGTVDPVGARKTAQARERQRKCRARKRAKRDAGLASGTPGAAS